MLVEKIQNFSTAPTVDYRASLPIYYVGKQPDEIFCVKTNATCNRYALGDSGAIAIYNSSGGMVCSTRSDFTWTTATQTYDSGVIPEVVKIIRCVISVFQDANLKYRFRVKFTDNIGQFDLDEPGYVEGPSSIPIFEKMATVACRMTAVKWQFQCPLVFSSMDGKGYVTGIRIQWTGYSSQPEIHITVWRAAFTVDQNLIFTDLAQFSGNTNNTELSEIAMKDANPLLNWSRLYSSSEQVNNSHHGNSEMDGVWNTVLSVFSTQGIETIFGRIDNLGGSLVAR